MSPAEKSRSNTSPKMANGSAEEERAAERQRLLAAIEQLERTSAEIIRGRASKLDSVDLLPEVREYRDRQLDSTCYHGQNAK